MLQKTKKKTIKLWRRFVNRFPSELPKTVKDLDTFILDVLQTYDLPTDPSYRHAVASTIMHLGTLQTTYPKALFAKVVKKAMANQAAYETIQSLKKEEEAYFEKIRAANSNGVKGVQGPTSEVVS